MKKSPSGRPRTVRTTENIEKVQEAVSQSPERSARRQSAALGISDRTIRRILHKDLNFHPYKLAMVNELNDGDYPQRLKFAQEMQTLYEANEDLHVTVVLTDEAHFYLNGEVNKQNCRYWSPENPRRINERPLHSPKVTVWCAVGTFGIIGPYFFEENGAVVTVTFDRYIVCLIFLFLIWNVGELIVKRCGSGKMAPQRILQKQQCQLFHHFSRIISFQDLVTSHGPSTTGLVEM